MDEDDGKNGIENKGYVEEEYSNIPWADNTYENGPIVIGVTDATSKDRNSGHGEISAAIEVRHMQLHVEITDAVSEKRRNEHGVIITAIEDRNTGHGDSDPAINKRNSEHEVTEKPINRVNDIESVSYDEADEVEVSHHSSRNSHKTNDELHNYSATSNRDDSIHSEQHETVIGGEKNKDSTFNHNQLPGSVGYVKNLRDSKDATPGQTYCKHKNGLDVYDISEARTVVKKTSQDGSQTQRKTGWLSRFCVDAIFRSKVGESFAVHLVMMSMGWIYGSIGPSLPDLQIISGMGLQEASWIFTGFAIGYMIGCTSSGILASRFSARTLLASAGIVAGVAVAILPMVPNGYVMVAMRIVGGVTMGIQNTTMTARLFALWGSDGGRWLQVAYFMFALGGIMSPLVIKPFLAQQLTVDGGVNATIEPRLDVTQAQFDSTNSNGTITAYTSTASTFIGDNWTADGGLALPTESAIDASTVGKSNIHYAFLISAILSVLSAVPFIIYCLKDRQKQVDGGQPREDASSDNAQKLPKKWKYVLLTLMCVSSMIATGYVDMFPNYLTSFGILQMGASKEDGSSATAILFATVAAGNLSGVVILKYISSGKYITIAHTAITTSFALYYFSIRLQLTKLVQWIFVAMIGFPMAAILPTLFTWTQDNVAPISGRIASVYLVSGSLGVMVTPMLLGYLMENVIPMWFLYVMSLYEVSCIVLFVAAVGIVRCISSCTVSNGGNIQV